MAAGLKILDGLAGNTILDLNLYSGGSGFLLGDNPDLISVNQASVTQRPVTWSPLLGPDVASSRTIKIPLAVVGTSPADISGKIQALSAAVASPFWLAVTPHNGANTSYLQCWPTIPDLDSDWLVAGNPLIARGTLECETEPYALGPRVDLNSGNPITITQDPSIVTAFYTDINGVTGDAITPLLLRTGDAGWINALHSTVIGVRRHGIPSAVPGLTVQGESASSATSGAHPPTVTTFTGDTAFSGGSGIKVTFPAGSIGVFDSYAVLSWITYPVSGPEAGGVYRLLVRARRSGATAGKEVGLGAHIGSIPAQDLYWPAGGNDLRTLDLGYFPIPAGQPLYPANPATVANGAYAPQLNLYVWQSQAGAGVVDIDYITLVPADEDCGLERIDVGVPQAGSWWLLDADSMAKFYTGDPFSTGAAIGQPLGSQVAYYLGGAPRVRPGNNRLYMVGGLGGAASATWPPTSTISMRASYFPRYTGLA